MRHSPKTLPASLLVVLGRVVFFGVCEVTISVVCAVVEAVVVFGATDCVATLFVTSVGACCVLFGFGPAGASPHPVSAAMMSAEPTRKSGFDGCELWNMSDIF